MRILMAAILAATLAAPALAAGNGYQQDVVRIRTGDLDLASAKGQRALDRRVATAMVALCGMPVLHSREEAAELETCRADALKAAAPQLDAARARLAMTVASRR